MRNLIYANGQNGTLGQHLPVDIKPVPFRYGDDHDKMKKFFDEIPVGATYISLGAITDSKFCQENWNAVEKVNIRGPEKALELFINSGGSRFIFVSTGHVYGETREGTRSNEEDLLNPKSSYAESKVRAESRLRKTAADSNVELVIVRLFSIFGRNMRPHFLAGKVHEQMRSQNFDSKIHNGLDVRDFLSPKEAISHIMKIATNVLKEQVSIYNVCSGSKSTIYEKIVSEFPSYPKKNFTFDYSSTPYLVGNPRKFISQFGENKEHEEVRNG